MCKQITRQEAYEKIIRSNISLMNEEQRVTCCLQWVGFEKCDIGYTELMGKMNDIYMNGDEEEKKMLYELLKSSKLYKIVGTTNTYLEYLLNQRYEVIGEIERMEECECCHHLSIADINIGRYCTVCGWSDDALRCGHILLEIGQELFAKRGHIIRWLSEEERKLNTMKYVKIEK